VKSLRIGFWGSPREGNRRPLGGNRKKKKPTVNVSEKRKGGSISPAFDVEKKKEEISTPEAQGGRKSQRRKKRNKGARSFFKGIKRGGRNCFNSSLNWPGCPRKKKRMGPRAKSSILEKSGECLPTLGRNDFSASEGGPRRKTASARWEGKKKGKNDVTL